MKLKKLLEGYAWERTPGKPLPTVKDVAKKHNESVNEIDSNIKSDILDSWKTSDIAQADIESFLKMLYDDGNYDTMDDFKSMLGVMSTLANDYYKKMRLG